MRRTVLAATLLAAAAAGVAAAPAPAALAPQRATVQIKDIDFAARSVTVRRGGTVTWRFLDAPTAHNVRSTGSTRFRGSPTKQRGTHRVTFTRRGTYRYVCTLHLNMKGRVVVR